MKKILFSGIVLALFLSTGFAQPMEFSKLCDKYKSIEGAQTFRINKFGCLIAALFVGNEESGVGSLVRSCSACQILVYDGNKSQELSREIKSYIRSSTLEELMTVKENKEEVRIYVEEQKDNIRQFFITVADGSEMVYIHLKGKFSRAKIRELMKAEERGR